VLSLPAFTRLRAGLESSRPGLHLNVSPAIVTLLIGTLMVCTASAAQACGSTEQPSARVFGIGDSIMLGAASSLERAINGIEIDAVVGRQASTGIDILRARETAGQPDDVVIFDLGTNGAMTRAQFDDVMHVAEGVQRVVFVNLTVPRAWEGPNNVILADGVLRYPNAVLVDWHALSSARPDFLWDDGIHLRPAGAEAYAALIAPYASAVNRPDQ
jgi:lysophospholipase L1-like esterase